MPSGQGNGEIVRELHNVAAQLRERNGEATIDAPRWMALVLIGAASKLLAGETDSQLLSDRITDGDGSFVR
jgi:hypothetical protein